MKQSLQLKLGQQLTMTPQLQQAIRLLQLSTLDLQQEIQEALDSNPMLEVTEDDSTPNAESNIQAEGQSDSPNEHQSDNPHDSEFDSQTNNDINQDDSSTDIDSIPEWQDNIPEDLPVDTQWDDIYQTGSTGSGLAAPEDDEQRMDNRYGTGESLQSHLLWQLNLTPMSERDQAIALTIIDAIEPSGLLSLSVDDLYLGLSKELEELEEDEVYAVLHRIQQFDPVGVAAQDLGDCLFIQLSQLPDTTPFLDSAKLIVTEHLILLGSRDYKTLLRKTRLKESGLAQAVQLIQTLNPHPGEQIQSGDTQYVVPDVFVSKKEGHWIVNLNPDVAPKIRINSDYASLVKRADTSSDNTFLRDNLQEARWFLKSLQSRNETLLKVSTCIVEKQKGFLDFGAEAMRPLVLHDIADAVGMHESTISRVTTQKFMHTPQGIFELKYFFSSHVSTDSGGECSSTAIRAIIKKLVAAENTIKPLSDSKITTLLEEQGIKVARRTIAKYRESLGIPASNERKRLA
jgi:RNA polymerase sigma-54 factor